MNEILWERQGMSDYERLGHLVKRERQRQYRTVDKARAAVQISRGAWDNVEHGRPVKELTYLAVEQALGWEEGSCERILAGGDPEPATRPLRVPRVDPELVETVQRADISDELRREILAAIDAEKQRQQQGRESI